MKGVKSPKSVAKKTTRRATPGMNSRHRPNRYTSDEPSNFGSAFAFIVFVAIFLMFFLGGVVA